MDIWVRSVLYCLCQQLRCTRCTALQVYILSKISDFTPRRTTIAVLMDVAMVWFGFASHLLPDPWHCE